MDEVFDYKLPLTPEEYGNVPSWILRRCANASGAPTTATEDQLHKELTRQMAQTLKKLAPSDRDLLVRYVGTPNNQAYYKQVSNYAWKPTKYKRPKGFKQLQSILHDKTRHQVAKHDMWVFRGMKDTKELHNNCFALNDGFGEYVWLKRTGQEPFQYGKWAVNRNLSTSITPRATNTFMKGGSKPNLAVFYIPKGYPIMYLPPLLGYKHGFYKELEVLIPSGDYAHIGGTVSKYQFSPFQKRDIEIRIFAPASRYSTWVGSGIEKWGRFMDTCEPPYYFNDFGFCGSVCPPGFAATKGSNYCYVHDANATAETVPVTKSKTKTVAKSKPSMVAKSKTKVVKSKTKAKPVSIPKKKSKVSTSKSKTKSCSRCTKKLSTGHRCKRLSKCHSKPPSKLCPSHS